MGGVPGPVCLDPRQDVNQDDLADQFWCLGAEGYGREPADRHTDHRLGARGELADGSGNVDGVARHV